MTIKLNGKQALVTGASQGIGRAIATHFAAAGIKVCLVGRDQNALQRLAGELGSGATVAVVDLSNRDTISKATSGLSIDILVNCGGMYSTGNMASVEADTFSALLETNVVGPYELTRQLLPTIIERRGQIVFINSSIVNNVGASTGQFAATAHALRAITDSLRAEVNPLGVRVLSVFPGRTATPRQAAIYATEGRKYDPDRLLQPEDIAASVMHSLSLPASAELTDLWLRPAVNVQKQ